MLKINREQLVNPEMSKYIKEQTYKYTSNLVTKLQEKYSINSPCRTCPNISGQNINPKLPNSYFILPFVSLISFLAGYKFCKVIHN